VGAVVYVATTLIPMPRAFKTVIYVLGAVVLLG
jgi:hypothetical protein